MEKDERPKGYNQNTQRFFYLLESYEVDFRQYRSAGTILEIVAGITDPEGFQKALKMRIDIFEKWLNSRIKWNDKVQKESERQMRKARMRR